MIPAYEEGKLATTIEDWYTFNRILLDYRIVAILPHVVQGPVLDVGCGKGEIATAIATELEMRVHGIDPDEEKIRGIEEVHGCTFHNTGLEECEMREEYNTVVCSHVLEHAENTHNFLRDCYSALNPGGRIIVTVPNALSLHKRIAGHMGLSEFYVLSVTDKMQEHKHLFDRNSLRALMRSIGFEIIVEKGIMVKPFSSAQMAKYLGKRWHDALYELGKDENLIDYCSSLLMVGRRP